MAVKVFLRKDAIQFFTSIVIFSSVRCSISHCIAYDTDLNTESAGVIVHGETQTGVTGSRYRGILFPFVLVSIY